MEKEKTNMYKKTLCILIIFSIFTLSFAQNTPKPYSDDEFSQTFKDIRRFEIITLGAIPFVTFDTIWIYSSIQAGSVTNPFTAKNNLSSDEIKTVILTSVGISLGIAITDLIINLIKRKKIDNSPKNILILPEELNPQNNIDTILKENIYEQEENTIVEEN